MTIPANRENRGNSNGYVIFAWSVLSYCVAVILWGAYVRASGSGAGCGQHWPLCNGAVIPRAERIQTMIEYSHRLSSGGSLLLVFALLAWTLYRFPRGSFQRKAAGFASLAIVLEALIGAGLVLLRLVEHDKSVDRVISISLHLENTLFLLACLTFLAHSAGAPKLRRLNAIWRERPLVLLVIGFALVAGLGAMTALGDTLFPASTLSSGLQADFEPKRHFLERLRIIHPVVAVLWVGGLWVWLAGVWQQRPELKRPAFFILSIAAFNLALGMVNVLTLAPIPVQIFHLLVANVLWIGFVGLLFRWAYAGFHDIYKDAS
jgi:heme A synthase